MANQIIYPENNPYPRNAFSCGQSKQGVSLYNSNFNNRLDKSAFVLNNGQIPLIKSRYLKYVNFVFIVVFITYKIVSYFSPSLVSNNVHCLI